MKKLPEDLKRRAFIEELYQAEKKEVKREINEFESFLENENSSLLSHRKFKIILSMIVGAHFFYGLAMGVGFHALLMILVPYIVGFFLFTLHEKLIQMYKKISFGAGVIFLIALTEVGELIADIEDLYNIFGIAFILVWMITLLCHRQYFTQNKNKP